MKKWEQRKKLPDKKMFGSDLSIKKNPKTQVSINIENPLFVSLNSLSITPVSSPTEKRLVLKSVFLYKKT